MVLQCAKFKTLEDVSQLSTLQNDIFQKTTIVSRKLMPILNNRSLGSKEIDDAGESSIFSRLVDDVQSEHCVANIYCHSVIWLSRRYDGNSDCNLYRGNLVIICCIMNSNGFSRNVFSNSSKNVVSRDFEVF